MWINPPNVAAHTHQLLAMTTDGLTGWSARLREHAAVVSTRPHPDRDAMHQRVQTHHCYVTERSQSAHDANSVYVNTS